MDLGRTLRDGVTEIGAFLPNLIGFLVILLIGFVVAKVVSAIVRKLLEKTGVDDHIRNSDANRYVSRVLPDARVSNGVSRVVFWLIFIFFLFLVILLLLFILVDNEAFPDPSFFLFVFFWLLGTVV